MKILKAYKFRIYPTKTQEVILNKTFGCVRYVWNQYVQIFNSHTSYSPNMEYNTIKKLRNTFPFLKEVSSGIINQKVRDFEEFKRQFFNSKRKIKLGRPKFKKKDQNNSFKVPNQKFKLENKNNIDKIFLEKIGRVKIILHREIPLGKFMSATVSKNKSDQYWVSIQIETEVNPLPKSGKTIGIDVGLNHFLTDSNNKIENPRYFRENQSKLRRLQKHFSRKNKDSRKFKKLKRIARQHQKIVNQREHFLHNVSTNLVKSYDSIYIEDLNISGMVKNRKLSKSISDASFSKFFSMLKYKCDWYGKTLLKISRFYPSSKTCSSCGNIKQDLKLNDRVFCCEACFSIKDRDHNAAINIHSMGVNIELKRT
jgi:putative transposase